MQNSSKETRAKLGVPVLQRGKKAQFLQMGEQRKMAALCSFYPNVTGWESSVFLICVDLIGRKKCHCPRNQWNQRKWWTSATLLVCTWTLKKQTNKQTVWERKFYNTNNFSIGFLFWEITVVTWSNNFVYTFSVGISICTFPVSSMRCWRSENFSFILHFPPGFICIL